MWLARLWSAESRRARAFEKAAEARTRTSRADKSLVRPLSYLSEGGAQRPSKIGEADQAHSCWTQFLHELVS